MTFEEHHEPVLMKTFLDCNQTVVDIRLSGEFSEVTFGEGRTGVVGMAVTLACIYQDLPWCGMHGGI
jgi:hypothetical protein